MSGLLVPFRGRSFHRQKTCPEGGVHDDGGWRCVYCGGGLFVCVNCGAAEGAVATDCPRVPTTPEQDDAVYEGRLDYILAAGGWVTPERPRAYPSHGAAILKCTSE